MPYPFSVVIINWNTRDYLIACIQSFIQSGISENEIIVVDQGSDDGSRELFKGKYPHIQLILNPKNGGYGQAVNLGISQSLKEYVIICNADIIVNKIDYELTAKIFNQHLDAVLLGPRIIDKSGKDVTRFSRTGILRCVLLEIVPQRFRGMWRDAENRSIKTNDLIDVSYIEGAFFIIRRSKFLSIGGFDNGITFFHEDADLPIRLFKAGYRVIHCPFIEIMHYGSASFRQVNTKQAFLFYRNIIRFYLRHSLRRAMWLKRILEVVIRLKFIWLFYLRIIIRKEARLTNLQNKFDRINSINIALSESISNKSVTPKQWNLNENPPWVTIVIPTYNRPACIMRILETLKEQTYQYYDILVIDQSDISHACDYSTIKDAKYKLKAIHSDFPNRSAAKNIGIKEATGDIILFCDDDIIPQKDLIEVHTKIHSNHTVGGVSCRVIEDNLPYIKSTRICKITWYGKMYDGFQSDVSCDVGTLVGGNMSIKKEILKEVGYFDMIYGGTSIYEEQDLSARISALGYRIHYSNRTYAKHAPQVSGNLGVRQSEPAQYYHMFHHNELIYFLKNRNHLFVIFVIVFCFFRSIKQMIRYKLTLKDGLFIFSGVWTGIRKYYTIMR